MATKERWREYFKLINDREPTLEDFRTAIKNGEIENMSDASENDATIPNINKTGDIPPKEEHPKIQTEQKVTQTAEANKVGNITPTTVLGVKSLASSYASGNRITYLQKKQQSVWGVVVIAIVAIGFAIWGIGNIVNTGTPPNGTYHATSDTISENIGLLYFVTDADKITFTETSSTGGSWSYQTGDYGSGSGSTDGTYYVSGGTLTMSGYTLGTKQFKYSKNLWGKISLKDTSNDVTLTFKK
ncbi:hypothetical protein [Lactococcus termiticola]|uniref:Uncharacterized protein n=1 Tax=Lactococcus termiticola TaxID=2169526 RepID=A0A2R5HDT4_9LACT|nr:hypothetical protein [Lactococcus termiticola]GBG96182.1 hypothetical protein NtB2_00293 [Lactococcus termiticola]